MRLDLFLKLSRLCPRRTVAQKLCDAGFVFLNGRAAKPSHNTRAGDEIVIRQPSEEVIAQVLRIPGGRNVSREQSRHLVEIVSRKTRDVLS
jgi:ribosomal 50S subunit-recycling heat shock protein